MSEAVALKLPLVIALVNNMPDAALKATERQFRSILEAAAIGIEVCFKYFYLPGIERSGAAQLYISGLYSPVEDLWGSQIDGLIVTGATPSAFALDKEPFWRGFSQLVDWAEDYGVSSYWSCLAAHAAVKHLSGIDRRPFDHKLSGIYECEKTADHHLLKGAPHRWVAPHSRYNDLPYDALKAAGYGVISRLSINGSPDIFVKEGKGLSIFAQGHLEYDRNTILLEYRRDLAKFLKGECQRRPRIPEGYFHCDTVETLEHGNRIAFLTLPGEDQRPVNGILQTFGPIESWRPMAVVLFSNWVRFLLEDRTFKRASRVFQAAGHANLLTSAIERRAE